MQATRITSLTATREANKTNLIIMDRLWKEEGSITLKINNLSNNKIQHSFMLFIKKKTTYYIITIVVCVIIILLYSSSLLLNYNKYDVMMMIDC